MHHHFKPKISGWSKTNSEGKPGLSVFDHCRHVGWVALELIRQGKSIPHTQIEPQVAAFIAAIHDVGKWSPGFLQMCPIWLEQEGLRQIAEREAWEAQKNTRHEKHSQDSIQLLLQNRAIKPSEAKAWSMIAGAHHGRMHTSENFGNGDISVFINDWHEQRHQIIQALEAEFDTKIPSIGLKKSDAIVLWLMGLASVADWIGSDEKHFLVDKGWSEKEGKESARLAVESIGLKKPGIIRNVSFEKIFGFKANDLQKKALSVIKKPGIYVIEAPMGLGKTEAALACAYELMKSDQASGIYFALPTQLTSNRIHSRVSSFIGKISMGSDKTRITHANAWLEKTYYQPRPVETLIKRSNSDATESRDWFASSKRALLANFGVGTIDQALMSVVAVKHFFVRRFALAGKVVIIDEVHSYDHFTGTLIRCLCQELQKLGCTIIILSATLLPDVRNDLIGLQEELIQFDNYPLITGKCTEAPLILQQKATPKPRPKVRIIIKNKEELFIEARKAANSGARVLWVCNTVKSSQDIFSELTKYSNDYEVGLLHSRFPHFIRRKQEEYWMERLGKNSKITVGCILVSTQIVEQSVDIDSDVLISELAPMDMLLQRIGRLWRHLIERPAEKRPIENPELWLIEEEIALADLKKSDSDELKKVLGIKAKVYHPYVLLKTYETLHSFNEIYLADKSGNSDIRKLLQLTYLNRQQDPESWEILSSDMKGTEYAEKQLAIENTRLFAKAVLKDEEGKQTRLNEIETLPLIIATNIDADKIILLNGDEIAFNPQEFNIQHARSIHQNIIRVHAWPYEQVEGHPAITFYLKGNHCLALLDENNQLKIHKVKEGVNVLWDETMGVIQTYDKGDGDESCD